MKAKLKEKFKQALSQGGISLLLSYGVIFPCLFALGLEAYWPWALALPLGATALCAALSLNQWAAIAVPIGVVVFEAAQWLVAGQGIIPFLGEIGRAVFFSFAGQWAAIPLYALEATVLLSVLASLVCYPLCSRNAGFYPVLAVCLAVLMILWLTGRQGLLVYTLPALCALVALYARSQHEDLRLRTLLPLAGVLVALAFALTPGQGLVAQPLKETAEQIRQAVYDYLFFTEPRNIFSLASEGYYPKGPTQLGGTAEPNDHPVMQVATPRRVLLRGTVKNEYTGRMWQDSTGGRRYLYISPQWRHLRAQTFDMELPQGAIAQTEGLFDEATVRVKMLTPSASSLFAPQRLRGLAMLSGDLVPYFNNASEIFITRDLQPGDEYTVTAPLFMAGDAGLSTVLAACQQAQDDRYGEIAGLYTALPAHLEEAVFELAYAVTANYATPYDKAMALQNYLARYYRYTLSPKEIPENVDFVSYFLLRSKEGYCTYFASAMTVLCRMVGLPARYVEGYIADPATDGIAYVTGKEAHAWTEIYFNGFGWLAFDATPPQQTQGNEPPQAAGASPEGTPEPSPQPQELPTPEPTPEPVAGETPPPQEQPPQNAENPTPPPESQASAQDDPQADAPPFPWWLLALLAAAGVLALRMALTQPAARVKHQKSGEGRVMAWAQAVYDLLYVKGSAPRANETPLQFAQRMDQAGSFSHSLIPLGQTLALCRYSPHPMEAEDEAVAQAAFKGIYGPQPWYVKARFHLYRAATPRRRADFTRRHAPSTHR